MMKKRFNFIKVANCYRYQKRSCANCLNASHCVSMVNKDWSKPWLDLARCGCRLYNGEQCGEVGSPKVEGWPIPTKRKPYETKGIYNVYEKCENGASTLIASYKYAKTAYSFKKRIEHSGTPINIVILHEESVNRSEDVHEV